MSVKDFLFELGTEELPPNALKSLSAALESEVRKGLQALLGQDKVQAAGFKAFAAPVAWRCW